MFLNQQAFLFLSPTVHHTGERSGCRHCQALLARCSVHRGQGRGDNIPAMPQQGSKGFSAPEDALGEQNPSPAGRLSCALRVPVDHEERDPVSRAQLWCLSPPCSLATTFMLSSWIVTFFFNLI